MEGWPLTDEDAAGDGGEVLTLQALIRARMDERGWNYNDLERLSGGRRTRGRWQQLGSGTRLSKFPDPETLMIVADVLQVDVTAVVLSAACSVGLPVRARGPDLAQLLPAGTDRLSARMRDSLLTMIRAAVAETLDQDTDREQDLSLEWPKAQHPQNWVRNAPAKPNERHG